MSKHRASHPEATKAELDVLVEKYPTRVLNNPATPLYLLEDPNWETFAIAKRLSTTKEMFKHLKGCNYRIHRLEFNGETIAPWPPIDMEAASGLPHSLYGVSGMDGSGYGAMHLGYSQVYGLVLGFDIPHYPSIQPPSDFSVDSFSKYIEHNTFTVPGF